MVIVKSIFSSQLPIQPLQLGDMSNVLKLYNKFTKSVNPVKLAGELVTPSKFNTSRQTYGSFYICGPTVYSDSHLGHAITYVRADLFRRWMKSLFNVKLITVMNITDVDDKIIDLVNKESNLNNTSEERKQKQASCDPGSHPFNKFADKYYKSFLDDMAVLGVLPADLSVKISCQVPLIVDFIRQLELKGNAYIVPSGDVVFKVSSIPSYTGRVDLREPRTIGTEAQEQTPIDHQVEALKLMRDSKTDPRDFILWKPAKANEPIWEYKSSVTNRVILGRPGWHVQCAAIASSIFGRHLDFHFGGKDLEFPHHYNEEACCCAFHGLDASNTLHVWSKNWLHSGHLVVRDVKMSKSLGNIIPIRQLIQETSVNVLRLLCVYSHYRSDLDYNQDLVDKVKGYDHKLSAFSSFLKDTLKASCETLPSMTQASVPSQDINRGDDGCGEIWQAIRKTREQILEGICDDFKLDVGLHAILELSRKIYSMDATELRVWDMVAASSLLQDWCDSCGLRYGLQASKTTADAASVDTLLDLLANFRRQVRLNTLTGLKSVKDSSGDGPKLAVENLTDLLSKCDDLRARLDELGLVLRDPKSTMK